MSKKGKRSRQEPDSSEFENSDFEENTNEINRLFGMGFVSLEEVEAFDAKKFLAEEAGESDNGGAGFSKKGSSSNAKVIQKKHQDNQVNLSGRDEIAVKSGWTVSKHVKVESGKEGTPKKKPTKTKTQTQTQPQQLPTVVEEGELSEWRQYGLHPLLLSGLKDANFNAPMPIQSSALKCLLLDRSKHLMASAPTGSGKTLSFGLPMLDFFYKKNDTASVRKDSTSDSKDTASDMTTLPQDTATLTKDTHRLTALVLVPTRELAIQIEKHLKAAAKYSPFERRPVRIATIMGGMSSEKQDRQLSTQPDIVIATPGRLAEAMEFDFNTRDLICSAKFLVLDEADRMIQPGLFKELDDILSKILAKDIHERRILLFSATLVASKDKKSPFAKLLDRLNLDRCKGVKEVAVVDLAGRPSTLHEWQCPSPSQLDKEGLVLYFLQDLRKTSKTGKFGRVLMFVNAIETIRRLSPLFTLLEIPVFGLHAQIQQRQRLKNLDRFKSSDECLLIASDVAARGLDIQGIEHVIHYHLPKDQQTYVHRCGRTARASRIGSTLALFAPEERKLAERCGMLGGKMARFSVDDSFISKFITPVVKLARKIETLQHTERATQSQVSWAQKAAEELGVELDEDNDPSWKQRLQHQAQGLNDKRTKKEIDGAIKDLKFLLEEIKKEF